MKKIAVLGSSGGNLFNQGGNDPAAMFKEIFTQAGSAGITIAHIQFVGTSASMDRIQKTAKSRLYYLENGELQGTEEKTLEEINELAVKSDAELAEKIRAGEIDGLILLSCDPKGVNHKSLAAAAEKQIPVTGTGGSSMAETRSLGCNILSATGTTGTTNRTRAVSFISVLAKEWGIKYTPVIGTAGGGSASQGGVWKRINFRGIMMASLPGFIAMALSLALSKIPALESLSSIFDMLIGALPVIIAAIAAKQVSGMDEVGIVAGIVGGVMSVEGGIIGGLAVGIIAGILTYYIIIFCFRHKIPGTTANIAAGGISGLAAGFIGKYAIAPIALAIGEGIKTAIEMALAYNAILAGAFAGFCIWFAIIGGVYHAVILPIVLLEMEKSGNSFLGSIDMCCLVLVCAGIMLANIVFPKQKSDSAVALPSLIINLLFGTFVEAAYPFMFSSKKVFAGAIISAALAGAFVGGFDVRATAYVPTFVAPTVANRAIPFIVCMIIALASAFILTSISNQIDKKKIAG
jgi:fructose-specific phosphotransferase system IIC component